MLKARILLSLGIWTAVLPYLGFPGYIKNILFVLTGLIIVYLSFVLYKEVRIQNKPAKSSDAFYENNNFTKYENESEVA